MAAHFFRHGELPLVILALLDVRPMHGYDLLAELADRFGPTYQPSPGSVYPAIAALQEEGLIHARPEGNRRVYDLTGAGRRALSTRRDRLNQIEARLGASLRAPHEVDALLDAFVADVRDDARRLGKARTRQLLTAWKRVLAATATDTTTPADTSPIPTTRHTPRRSDARR